MSHARYLSVGMDVQSWAKDKALGCMKSPPAATGSQEAGFTQPGPIFSPSPVHYICIGVKATTYNYKTSAVAQLRPPVKIQSHG